MVNIVVAKLSSGIVTSEAPVTLKNTPTLQTTGNVALAVENLINVVSTNEATGETLVYDSSQQQWVAKNLDLSYITGNLDGGTF